MQQIIIEILSEYGYWGVLLLSAVENIFPPIPSEVILTFAGFLTTVTPLTVFGVVFCSTLGSLWGAYALYGLGRLLSADGVTNLLGGKLGKVLHFDVEEIKMAEQKFAQKGAFSVFFCRGIPIVRSLISIPAGIAKMPIFKFTVLTIAGSTIWDLCLVSLGAFAGENWHAITMAIESTSGAVKTLIIIAAIVLIFLYAKRKKKKVKQL